MNFILCAKLTLLGCMSIHFLSLAIKKQPLLSPQFVGAPWVKPFCSCMLAVLSGNHSIRLGNTV